MKRWVFQIFAVLILSSTAFSVIPPKVPETRPRTTVHTFEEPVWKPIPLRNSSDNLPELDSRLEFIAIPNCVRHGNPVVHLGLRNNQATERTFVVEFLPFEEQKSSAATITRSVTLPPLGTANLTFPVFRIHDWNDWIHDWNDWGDRIIANVQIQETTAGVPRRVGKINWKHAIDTERYKPHILMDHRLSPEKFSKHLSEALKQGDEYNCDILRFKRPASDWPDDFRVYSTFDAVVVTPSLFAALPPKVHEALDDFTAFGGTVLVTPDDTESGGLTDPKVLDRFLFAMATYSECLSESNYDDAEFALKAVPLNLKNPIPIFWLISLLGIFTVLFIPIVVGVCIRRNHRFHVLAIVPIAAATLALVIGASSLIFYGNTPKERLQSVTVLDQRRQRATTWGQFAVFDPSPKSGEIAFPLDSTFLQCNFDFVSRHHKRRLSVEIDKDYRLVGDWVQPSIPTIFEFWRMAYRRERLSVKQLCINEIEVTNLLGVPIARGRLRLKGILYSLDGLQPGETRTLKSMKWTTDEPKTDRSLYHQLLADSDNRQWPKLVERLSHPTLVLPEATYIAFFDGSPFFPSPFGQHRTHGSREAIVIGQLAEDAK